MKSPQKLMIWFLPLITIGGLFLPWLGYLVVAMAAFFLTLSFFKPRFWCWNLCPRGAFLDGVLSKFSRNTSFPRFITKTWFRWSVFTVLIGFVALRIIQANGNVYEIGMVFVVMCLLTTILAIIFGFLTKHRAWCVMCPMGTLQEQIGKLNKGKQPTQ